MGSGHASGEAVVAVTIAMVALAGAVVLLRLYTRIAIVKSPGLDDAFIAASLVFSVATTVTMCLQGMPSINIQFGNMVEILTSPSQMGYGPPYHHPQSI